MLCGFACLTIDKHMPLLGEWMQTQQHKRCPTCHRRLKRTNQQNRLYWELLTMMAARAWGGQHHSDEAFHLYYRKRFLGCDDVRLPNGEVLTIPRSTAELGVDEFGEYFDRVSADCAERGVYLADLD